MPICKVRGSVEANRYFEQNHAYFLHDSRQSASLEAESRVPFDSKRCAHEGIELRLAGVWVGQVADSVLFGLLITLL